ncbi:hypothetical protein SDC9_129795 [bioreactor metagenome]|uniref:Uncharacterized protein n=1 Tax=bioreactor metagenome TaxID=1076179 RepID=A0A645D0X3_9ZZZZ
MRRPRGCKTLACRPVDVHPCKICHGKRAHREAECLHGGIDLRYRGPLFKQKSRFSPVTGQHAVSHKAFTNAHQHGDLADGHGHLHAARDDCVAGALSTHHFQQLHHIGRTEEMQADDIFGSLGRSSNLVDVQPRCIGGKNRTLFADPVEQHEHIALDSHIFENGFYDQINFCERRQVQCPMNVLHPFLDRFGTEPSTRYGNLIVALD